ncbi:M-phase inducer phosphatase 1-B-like [Mytilus trossulus]|uniref:M-phase inducer phosphatase 1-B-like n=1 Tax=Mytilus trossulus TaxID=6551 RepID=UPI0030045BCD
MLSRRLFDTCDELIQASLSSLSFDSTPVKANDLMSVMTSNIKQSLLPNDDDHEDSGLGMDEHLICTLSLTKSAKRQRKEEDNSSCSKRSKICTDIKTVITNLEENDDFIADGIRLYTLPTVTGKHSDLKSITPQTLVGVVI